MKQYKVVRTYDDGKTSEKLLQEAFDEGYEFVRASEYIPESNHDGRRRYGYIEYVLAKIVNEDKIADVEALQPRIIDAVHGTICDFFEPVPDDSGEPMTPFDSRLLTVNKKVCNRIREVFDAYSRGGKAE